MSDEAMRGIIRAFYEALISRDSAKIEPFLADDAEWAVFGPPELFPFCGARQGKKAALAACDTIAAHLELLGCDREAALISGDSAAVLVRCRATCLRTGHLVSFRMAQFTQVRDGKIVGLKVLFDTLDAAEQVLGREFDLSAVA